MMSNPYKFLPQLNIDWGCETNISIDMPGLFIDNSTQTSPVKDMASGELSPLFGVTDKRTSNETPQVLASQCRGLLQQLSKLQLAHHSRENLYRLKTELKELIAIFSNAANKEKQPSTNPGSAESCTVQTKGLGRPRKNILASSSVVLARDLSITKEDAQSPIRQLQTRKTYPQRYHEVDKVNANGVASVFKNYRQSPKEESIKVVSQKRPSSNSLQAIPAKLNKEENDAKEDEAFDFHEIGPTSVNTGCLTTIIDGKTVEIPLEQIRVAIATTSNSLDIAQTELVPSEELISEDDAVK